jgi:hypothetical protein
MGAPTLVPLFFVRQKITLMVNRHEIRGVNPDGSEGPRLTFAEQKRMKFKEEVTFYADETRARPVFSFKARQGLDVHAEHDVFDEHGNRLGYFRKDFATSLASRQPVMTSERRKSIGDRYTVMVPDQRVDFRVAAAMAVALDALQSR